MTPKELRLIPRIGLFAALIYILSMATAPLPNVNLIFFIVFIAGFMWGAVSGMLVGAFGMGLSTFFSPFGPAALPVMIAQIVGASLSGMFGAVYFSLYGNEISKLKLYLWIPIFSILCTLGYFIPVNIVDSWLFQPFWERFYVSSFWSLISVGSNMLLFTLLFPALISFCKKEQSALC